MGPSKKKQAGRVWQKYAGMGFGVLIGAVCGILMVRYTESFVPPDASGWESLGPRFLLLLVMYAAMTVQLVVHEAGHLVFGLLSGYRFSSFRVFSFMWIKDSGRIRLRRHSIAGTGGQCLMVPPDPVDGTIPVILYNLGGSLMNLIWAAVFLGIYFAIGRAGLLGASLLIFAVMGFVLGLTNGIPLRMGNLDNDGRNALSLSRSKEAAMAFWVQLKVSQLTSQGVRLKDMPEEWFRVPSDEEMKNSMMAAVGVFACNRLMDSHEFQEADRLMARLLALDSGMVGLHRQLLVCERMYVELVTENRPQILAAMRTKEQLAFMKQMKSFSSVLRTEYVYALLGEKDPKKAEAARAAFEKRANSHPYPSDIQSERELMAIAEARARERAPVPENAP